VALEYYIIMITFHEQTTFPRSHTDCHKNLWQWIVMLLDTSMCDSSLYLTANIVTWWVTVTLNCHPVTIDSCNI